MLLARPTDTTDRLYRAALHWRDAIVAMLGTRDDGTRHDGNAKAGQVGVILQGGATAQTHEGRYGEDLH